VDDREDGDRAAYRDRTEIPEEIEGPNQPLDFLRPRIPLS
jgi:hypothetical protein